MSQWQTAGKVRMTPMGTWSASTAYVVLDCVSNTDKTAYYVAKQNVPAGTALTNTEYWEVINDISDIVSQLTNEIERLEDIVALGYPTVSGVGKFINAEGTIDAPLSGLIIYGKSVQSDGTPSPSAPATIVTAGSGGTLAMVSAAKNLLRRFINTSGTGDGCTWTFDGDTGTYTLTSIVGSGSNKVVYDSEIVVRNAAGQTLTLSAESITGDSNASVRIHQGDNQLAMIYGSTLSTTFRVPNDEPLTMMLRMGNATASGVTAILKGVQLEVGSARTNFAPMLDKLTAAIPTQGGLPGVPVASGGNYTDTGETQWICDTIDLEAGTWVKRCGIINSYNGEALPGVWLSSMDVYQSGATPTSGAKVVYALAAPEVVQLTTAQLTALKSLRGKKGLTNLYSTDSTQPEFKAKVYIDIPTYINSLNNASTSSLNASLSSTLNSPNSLSLTNNLEEENTAEEETPEESTELTEEGTET